MPSFDETAVVAKPEPKFKKNEPIASPLARENKEKNHQAKQLTVTLHTTGNHERDKRRIKTLHGILTSFHGSDKFSFHMFENKNGYMIDFPSETTHICPDLLARLKKLIGEESWRVEEITFQ